MNRIKRAVVLILFGAALLWIANESLIYYRDNFSTHYPVKSVTPELSRDGLPLWNPLVGGGQPLAGNPNNLTFYPTTLLFFFLPAHFAFNLHFLIHLVVAWFGMRRLLLLHDVEPDDASTVSWLYVFSGTTISCLVFYNLVVAAALMPWGIAALIRLLDRRALKDGLYLGCVCGLISLAAEPVIIIGFTILAISLLLNRFSVAALRLILLATVVSAAVASPLLVAYAEIAQDTERAHFSYGSEWALAASIGPYRLAEIVTGPVYGSVLDHTERGYWANQSGRRWPPYFLSIMLSALVLPSFFRSGRQRLWQYRIPILIFLFVGLGRFNPVVRLLFEKLEGLGTVRYPEKLALLITLAACILIGILFRDLRGDATRLRIPAMIGVGFTILVTLAVLLTTTLETLATVRLAGVAALQLGALGVLLIPGRITNLARTAGLLALVPLVYWSSMLIPIDRAGYYTNPSPVASAIGDETPIEVPNVAAAWNLADSRTAQRFYAFRLNPVFGMRFGIPYVLTGSPEGMHSYLSRLATERAQAVEPAIALNYLRINGAGMTVRSEPLPIPGVTLEHRWRAWPGLVYLYSIDGSRPLVWEPSSALRVDNVEEAFERIESESFDPLRDTIVPSWVDETVSPNGTSAIRTESKGSQEMVISVQTAAPTMLVVNQSWFSAWRASIGDRELVTFPADVDRLGIIVPAGESTIHLEFGRHRLLIAASLAGSSAIQLCALGFAIWPRKRTAISAG